MSGFHGIFKKAVIVSCLFQHAHTALGKIGIVAGKVGFGYNGNFFIAGKFEGTVKAGTAAACDEDICFHSGIPFCDNMSCSITLKFTADKIGVKFFVDSQRKVAYNPKKIERKTGVKYDYNDYKRTAG